MGMRGFQGARRGGAALGWLCLALLVGCGSGSGSDEAGAPPPPVDGGSGRASARIATTRAEMVGGTRALGEVGDFLMENEKIRVVIQKEGFSRGFGVYGGGLLDADLRRPSESGSSGAAVGNDQFAELFPAFLVQAVAVDQVRVTADGSDGGPARVEATGLAGDFLELVAFLNRAVTGSNQTAFDPSSPPRIRYTTTYELAPGAQYLTLRFRVENISDAPLLFPGEEAQTLGPAIGLDLTGFTVPIADIALFGATSKVFIPGVGFDLRFGLERAYARGIDFPAFPGIVSDFVASRGEGASYGLIMAESERNYAYNKRDIYGDGRTEITRSSVLVPFVASAFLALFWEDAPPRIAPGESFETVKYFVVGSGDVGSVLDVIHQIRGVATGRLGGQVNDAVIGSASQAASVVVYQRLPDGSRRPYSQYDVRENGSFAGSLAEGAYSLKVVGPGRPATDFVDFEIRAGETTALRVDSTPPGRIFVGIRSESGELLPAKATAVGRYGAEHVGKLTPEFLFDLEAGEDFRNTDMIPDSVEDPDSRQYIEAVAYTANGTAELLVRPGTYEVVSSRGPEYEIARSTVSVGPGQTATVQHALHRVVDTLGWMAVDSHIHSHLSIDSGMDLNERVVSLAAEGVEVAVSSDHNYITDYSPYVARNDLTRWLHPMVGVEMTTLESGHYNGYPLRYQVGPITHGAFEWARRPPGSVFEEIRSLGADPTETIVQVNHPRDDLIGYFNQYERDGLTAAYKPPSGLGSITAPTGPAFVDASGQTTFSDAFDAVEVLNGKLYYQIRHYRVPRELPPGDLPDPIPPTGSILQEEDGDVAFPGAVDDWFNLLNLGYTFTGVGTGDSHSGTDEAGQFRTMLRVGVDNADAIDDRTVVEALRAHRAIATNGPMIDFAVNDWATGSIGSTIVDPDGAVTLSCFVTAAPWISVERIVVHRNGLIAHVWEIDPDRDLTADPLDETIDLELARDSAGEPIDSWFVIEAIGYRSMHPVVRTAEVPPLVLSDALASLAGPLGLSGDEFGDLRPPETFPVTPYAISNPVWVTTDEGPFDAPGIPPLAVRNLPENDSRFQEGIFPGTGVTQRRSARQLLTEAGRLDVPGRRNVGLFYPLSGDWRDARKILSRLGTLGRHGAH